MYDGEEVNPPHLSQLLLRQSSSGDLKLSNPNSVENEDDDDEDADDKRRTTTSEIKLKNNNVNIYANQIHSNNNRGAGGGSRVGIRREANPNPTIEGKHHKDIEKIKKYYRGCVVRCDFTEGNRNARLTGGGEWKIKKLRYGSSVTWRHNIRNKVLLRKIKMDEENGKEFTLSYAKQRNNILL